MIFQVQSTDFTRRPGPASDPKLLLCQPPSDHGPPGAPEVTSCEAFVRGEPWIPPMGGKGRGWVWPRGADLTTPPPGAAPFRPLGYLVLEVRLHTVFPALKHVGQLVQAAVVEMENLELALAAGDDHLAAGAGLIAGRPRQGKGTGQ